MRFLLHPRTSSAVKSIKGKAVDSLVISAPSSGAPPAVVTSLSSPATNSPSSVASNNNGVSNHTTKAWGQQCSPTCGCVVRFEATYDSDTQAIRSASYHAKRIVTRTIANNKTTAHPGTEENEPQLQAVLTAKGRPMMTECSCKSLHHLSSVIVESMVAQPSGQQSRLGHSEQPVSFAKLRSSLEFKHLRSSPAFRKTVLAAQQLPSTDTHCFDVVEEALTALVKGHMPKARRRSHTEIKFDDQEEYPSEIPFRRHAVSYEDDGDDEYLQFGQLWSQQDYLLKPPAVMPRAMSTLRMFDDEQVKQEDVHYHGGRLTGGPLSSPPTDWESYVDQMNKDEESA